MKIKIDKKEYDKLLRIKENSKGKDSRIEYLEGMLRGFKEGRDFTNEVYEKVLATLIHMNNECKN